MLRFSTDASFRGSNESTPFLALNWATRPDAHLHLSIGCSPRNFRKEGEKMPYYPNKSAREGRMTGIPVSANHYRTSRFYTLVSNDTREQEFSWKRQRFFVEQGYRYQIVYWQSPSGDIEEMGRAAS
jgi:hypothetical protein